MEHNIFGKGDVLLLQLFCYVCSLLKIKLQFLISSNLKLFSLYFIAMSPLFMHIRLLFILLWHFKSYLNKMNRTITTIRNLKNTYPKFIWFLTRVLGNEKIYIQNQTLMLVKQINVYSNYPSDFPIACSL